MPPPVGIGGGDKKFQKHKLKNKLTEFADKALIPQPTVETKIGRSK
jgi:hypothetical protein